MAPVRKFHSGSSSADRLQHQQHDRRKVPIFKRGDWFCKDCHTHNFASKQNCYRCHSPIPSQESQPDLFKPPIAQSNNAAGDDDENVNDDHRHRQYPVRIQRSRPGDWTCADQKCRAVNFSGRKLCLKCGQDKPEQPHEWECPKCGYDNIMFRSTCRECSTANPRPRSVQEMPLRQGDWTCSGCQHYNFARRQNCQECDAVKPSVEVDESK